MTNWLALERRAIQPRFSRQPRAVLFFPAPYSTAIANLGFQTIWRRLNDIPDFSCDRAFWDARLASPPEGLQTQRPLKAFPLILISSSFELDLAAVLKAFLRAGIEPLAAKRSKSDPVVALGGFAATSNPKPWGPFLDVALLGEGEELVERWVAIYQSWKEKGGTRRDLWEASAQLPAAWIPGQSSRCVEAAQYDNYRNDPASSVAVHPQGHFGDCWLVEMTRGCPHGCKFCAVCAVYAARFAKTKVVLEKLEQGDALNSPKIGLMGGAVGDHPGLKEIVEEIIRRGRTVTLSSMRIEHCDQELLELLVKGGLKTLTVAPETGCDATRILLGKKVSNEDLTILAQEAARCGIQTLRLYFLIGLPVAEDCEAISHLVRDLRRDTPNRLKLDVSVSSFIPKPGTPWGDAPFADVRLLDEIKRKMRAALRPLPRVSVAFEATRAEREAALLSRGDESVGLALLRAIQAGRPLEQEMRVSGLDMEKYLDFSEWKGKLPWGFISRHK